MTTVLTINPHVMMIEDMTIEGMMIGDTMTGGIVMTTVVMIIAVMTTAMMTGEAGGNFVAEASRLGVRCYASL